MQFCFESSDHAVQGRPIVQYFDSCGDRRFEAALERRVVMHVMTTVLGPVLECRM